MSNVEAVSINVPMALAAGVGPVR
ncbi:MAG: hypothetical protein QOE83_2452, partial [Actinomycetota bacterium]|nr:hypothetical protein [Actinomycetota bacterium]